MSLWRLVAREIAHRPVGFILGALCIAAATGALIGSATLLVEHDARTHAIIEESAHSLDLRVRALDGRMRRAMLRLGFNITILPSGQDLGDWHTDGYASKRMPADTVQRLAAATPVMSAHFLPALRGKLEWPERRWTVIIVGVASEVLHPLTAAPEVSARAPSRGEAYFGFELHRGLGLNVGDEVRLMGRKLRVGICAGERGGPEDVTIRMNLSDAQELFGTPGQINEIHALATPVGLRDTAALKTELARILPAVEVVENSPEVQANRLVRTKVIEQGRAMIAELARERGDLRRRMEHLSVAVGAPVGLLCVAFIVLSAAGNVRDRRDEIGILTAIGYRPSLVGGVCLLRFCLMGLAGGLVGTLSAAAAGARDPGLLIGTICLALGASCLSAWIPVARAASRDPAMVLRK